MSGGPDSLALLLLAAAAFPGRVEAATVDHGLRSESGEEALFAASVCASLGVVHAILKITWETPPEANVQGEARERRYAALGDWAMRRGLSAVATAHHADDQAETVLMRLGRGAGVRGLGGIRPSRPLSGGVELLRPLLGWRREELRRVVDGAGISPVEDPSNRDDRYLRTGVRELLARSPLLDAQRLADSAANCRSADEALEWIAAREAGIRTTRADNKLELNAEGLPREILRRILVRIFCDYGAKEPAGPDLIRAINMLEQGGVTTLSGLKLEGGQTWTISPAPPRRS